MLVKGKSAVLSVEKGDYGQEIENLAKVVQTRKGFEVVYDLSLGMSEFYIAGACLTPPAMITNLMMLRRERNFCVAAIQTRSQTKEGWL